MLTIPGYTVQKELGRGGMGVVYLAHNTLMDRLEVIKVIRAEGAVKASGVDRFLKEIQAAARLNHPNVVTAYSALRPDGGLALAMAYVDGTDLDRLVRANGPLPVRRACNYVAQAATGLQHALDMGLCHRDIKPSNLMATTVKGKTVVKVLDFGLAKVRGAAADDRLTGDGQMMGTPAFVAPEQARDAAAADTRADVYSLGCTLYFLLTGRPPFRGALTEVLLAHQTDPPPPLPGVPPELAAVVAKMMAKEPADRYQTPEEVSRALRPFAKAGPAASGELPLPPTDADSVHQQTLPFAAEPPRSRRPLWLAGGSVAVVAVIVAVVALLPKKPPPADPPAVAGPADPPPFSFDGTWRVSLANGHQLRRPWLVTGQTFAAVGAELEPPPDAGRPRSQPQEWSRDGNAIRVVMNTGDVTTLIVDPADPDHLAGENQLGGRVWWDRVTPADPWPARMVPLFDGATLSGWKSLSPPETNWSVVDGRLAGRNRSKDVNTGGWLLTQRPAYRNFRLRAELSRGGQETGVRFRLQGNARGALSGYSVVLRGTDPAGEPPGIRSGTLLAFNAKTSRLVFKPTRDLDKPGVNVIELEAVGSRFTVRLNGELAGTATDPEYTSGDFGLHCRSASHVYVHKFEVDRRPD